MVFLFSKNFWRSRSVFILVGCAAAVHVFTLIILGYRVGLNVEHMPLHYNIYLGVDWFASGLKIYSYPFLGLMVQLVNIIIASFVFGRHKHVSYLLLLLSLFCNIVILFAVFVLLFFQRYYF